MFSWLARHTGKVNHPMYNMAEAEKLLDELPADDPFEALEAITAWLESITATPALGAELRVDLVELLDETARPIHAGLLKSYLAEPHLQDFQGMHLWQNMHAHTVELAQAYDTCLAACKHEELPHYRAHELLPLLSVRLMRALAERMKLELMRYLDVENDTWARLFKCYADAEAGQYAHSSLLAYPGYALHTSVQHELLRALVVHQSSPGNLAPDQIEVAFRVAARMVSFFDISHTPDVTSEYWIDLAHPGPPHPVDDTVAPSSSMRFFTPLRALPRISDIIRQHERGSVGEEHRFGGEFTPQGKLTVLKHLLVYWNKYHPRRAVERMGIHASMDVTHGFRSIIGLLRRVDPSHASGLSKQEAAALASRGGFSMASEGGAVRAPETWTLIDASLSGIGCLIPKGQGAWVKVGHLIGLKAHNTRTWWVAVIRRLHAEDQHAVRVGIEILGKKSLAVWLRVPAKGADPGGDRQTRSGPVKYDYYPAILLPDAQNAYLHATILLETGIYREGKRLEVMLGEKNRNIELTSLEAEGEDHERVNFNWVAPSDETTK